MTEEDEIIFDMGYKAALRLVLAQCVKHLPDTEDERRLIERTDTIAALRAICAEYGDNDWPDNLHMADIINKHLLPHLEAAFEDES